jgi:Protein of unknown function (DUF3363)
VFERAPQALDENIESRIDHLVEQGLDRRQGQRVIFARDLINTLRQRELDDAATRRSAETGLAHRPSAKASISRASTGSASHLRPGRR